MTEAKFTVTVRSWRPFDQTHVASELDAFTTALVEFQTSYRPIVAVAIETPNPPTADEPRSTRG